MIRFALISALSSLLLAAPAALAHPDHFETESGAASSPAANPASSENKSEAPKWDVNQPPGPFHDVPIDTTQGTWMNLDVSPDGKEIVFDLLGDLYTLPMAGGEATSLTQGIAWDMQPKYSPDGRYIAFTSDRAGGNNIWIVSRSGGEPTPVTKESYRLVNSPAWSPDSEFIVARKHFTSTRSLGAGEMWLYHRSGGDGVQMTKKPTEQKDVGEPAFSPDGRYLYYSLDSTPGAYFEYNKDPNGQIYTIQRLDRQTGEVEDFITGQGGAIRPTPSPDQRYLAFIRRIRGKSVLHLMELSSHRIWRIADGLDRDMQETWAVFGVYPSLAFTPDSRSIVFWAGGKIKRVDIVSQKVVNIPFHVKSSRAVFDALRFPVDVAPDTFRTKMVRWPSVSPTGDRVVFQALGHLYLKELPNGTPTRLTTQNEHFEFYPQFSRDGSKIVYTTWNDETLGSIRIIPAKGGKARALPLPPGHYVEPTFSPDGKKVVYRKFAGGYLVGDLGTGDSGIYALALDGALPSLISKAGSNPHFGKSNSRIFLLESAGEDKRQLVSVDIDSSDRRTILTAEKATTIQVSPDERFVAFEEGYQAYVTPFFDAGLPTAIGPKMTNLPVARVSRDAGSFLYWSADSQSLNWSVGPQLLQRNLKDAFAFMAGAPEKLPEPAFSGLELGFEIPTDRPAGKIALKGARIITMNGDAVIEHGTVIVEKNRIVALGPADSTPIPADAKVIDISNNTIIPGLIDVHWHGSQGFEGLTPQQNWINYSGLSFGVTTAHDPSNDTYEVFAASELGRAGLTVSPRLFSTGTILYGANADVRADINSLEDALNHIRRLKAAGAFSVKSYNQPRREQRQQVIAAARAEGMMVVPEGGSLFENNMTMIVDGHTGIEHGVPVAQLYDDVLDLWSESRTGYTPTLGVGYGGIQGDHYWYHHTEVWKHERLLAFVPRPYVDAAARRPTMAPDEEYNHFAAARACKQLIDRGISVQLGAHGQREGLAAHWEIWMMAQGGMTPLEALRVGTLNGAKYLGMDKDLGSIEVGKLADIVVLEKNPLENIRNSEFVRFTMVNGRLYDAITLDEIGNYSKKRNKFTWEIQGTAPELPAKNQK